MKYTVLNQSISKINFLLFLKSKLKRKIKIWKLVWKKKPRKEQKKNQTLRKQSLFSALLTMSYVPRSEGLFKANRHMAYIVDIFLEKYLPVLVSNIIFIFFLDII